jgi:hypothetical protein
MYICSAHTNRGSMCVIDVYQQGMIAVIDLDQHTQTCATLQDGYEHPRIAPSW